MSFGEGLYSQAKISMEAYLADPCPEPSMNASTAKALVTESPAHAWCQHPRGGNVRRDDTDATKLGTLIDFALLGGDVPYVCVPEQMPDAKGKMVRTNGECRLASAKAWKEEQEAAGKMVVARGKLERVEKDVAEIRHQLEKAGMVLDGESQVTGIWKEGDVWLRCRYDSLWLKDGTWLDIKTANDISDRGIQSSFINYGYDIAHAHYSRFLETMFPGSIYHGEYLFIESHAPFTVRRYVPTPAMSEVGRWRWAKALRMWQECMASRKFPSHPIHCEVQPPEWIYSQMQNELLDGGSKDAPF